MASAADCCAELSPFHTSLCHVGQRCQGLQHCDWVLRVWFSRASGPRRRTTCACVWRASCGAAFRSWHGGHFAWLVLLTAALSCAPTEHHCAMSARDVRGFNVWVRCFLARSCVGAADMHDMCLWLFRASWCSSIGIARWSLRVASAADRCAELSPFHASLCHVGQRCLGLQHFPWVLCVWFVLASELLTRTTCACGSGVRAVAQLSGRGTVVTSGGECC